MFFVNRIMRIARRGAGWLLVVERFLRRRREARGHQRAGRTAQTGVARHHSSHADERTIRKVAEEQEGGISSAASRTAYERGENPGGLHHGGTAGTAPPHRGGPPDDQLRSADDGADDRTR